MRATTPEPSDAIADPALFPFDVRVCSRNQLRRHAKRFESTHVVSLIEMEAKVVRPSRVRPENHRKLIFDDVEDSSHPYAPQPRHIESLLAFGRMLPAGARVMVHCQAGQCRSTAGALALLAQAAGPEHAEAAMAHILAVRPIARPNMLVTELADTALGADGALIAAARRANEWQEAGRQGPLFGGA